MLRVLAASTALVACNAHAQYGGGGGRPVIGLPPSVELNLDVLTKLRPPPVQEMRKVPSEQPYSPPVRLPAMNPPAASVVTRTAPAMPFAHGESGANILSDVSSANYKPEAKPVAARPAARSVAPKPPAPVAAAAPAPAPAPVAPPVSAPAPTPPAPMTSAPAPLRAAQPASPPINNAPMMIPVKPKPAPVPMVAPPAPVQQPAPVTAAQPAAMPKPPAPLPTGAVPAAPAPIPAPLPVTAPAPVVKQAPKPAPAAASAIPPMVPITSTAKPALNVPPPPSLEGLDFSNMKANDPDGMGDLTPQKLLGKPVETMVVARPSTLPEIEVPAATTTDRLPTVTKEKPADGMLPSISNRVDKLFTKDDVKMGVTNDSTRVINPVAEKQKEVAAKAEAAKAAAPKLPDVAGLPPLPLPDAPKEKSIKIDSAKPVAPTLKMSDPLPSGLPSLDAITGTKPAPSSMDIVQPKDGIIATEKMPPAKLPEPIPSLPVVKKEEAPKKQAAPKVTVEEKKPVPPAPIVPPVKEVKQEAPKPPASPLAITPKEKPNIKEDTKIAALPPLPDFGSAVKKPDPALAPALPQLPPPTKTEAKKPEPVMTETIKTPEVQVKAPAPKEQAPKAPAPLSAPKPPPGDSVKPSASVGFTKDATDLSADAKTELMQLADRIKKDDASVRVVAYAKGSEDEASIARRISLSRALQIRAFLIDKGVNQYKINVQALGHKVPGGNADRADVVVY